MRHSKKKGEKWKEIKKFNFTLPFSRSFLIRQEKYTQKTFFHCNNKKLRRKRSVKEINKRDGWQKMANVFSSTSNRMSCSCSMFSVYFWVFLGGWKVVVMLSWRLSNLKLLSYASNTVLLEVVWIADQKFRINGFLKILNHLLKLW